MSTKTDQRLLSLLYEGAGREDGWSPFMEAFVSTYPGGKGGLALHDPTIHQGMAVIGAGWAAGELDAYDAHYAAVNPWMARIHDKSVGQVSITDSLVPRNELIKTEFYSDWLTPTKVGAGIALQLRKDGTRHLVCTVLFPEVTAERDPDVLGRLERLAPHILRVSQLNRQIAMLEARAQAAESALEARQTAMLIVNDKSGVLYLNAAAERLAAAADGVKLTSGTLDALRPREAQALRRLIAEAGRSRDDITTPPGGTLRISRPSGLAAYEVLVSPVAGGVLTQGFAGAAAAVFLRDPARTSASDMEHLRQLYGLTLAEAKLMMALLTEDTLDSAAARFSLSKETLRSQLKSIFHKTGTRSQLELLRLGLRQVRG